MAVLITGASGFLGKALVERFLKKGRKVYGLSRHPLKEQENLIPITGDIMEHDFGLDSIPEDIDSIQHLAAIHRLGEDKDGSIWQTNVAGTRNVIAFCAKHAVERLYFCSTAYTEGRNTYEKSKAVCEMMVWESDIKYKTIFKPSIIMGTPQHFYPGHLCQFVHLMVKVHKRMDAIRRKIEGTFRLPVIEPVFRVRGNPDGRLNLISVNDVADTMASISAPGKYWLTNAHPPTLKQIAEWISEFILVRLSIATDFKPMPLEIAFAKMSSAFAPYAYGDDFPSDIPHCQEITKRFIHDNLLLTLLT